MRRLAILAAFIVSTLQVEACTGIKLQAQDGSVVNGRTLEFGTEVDVSIALIPRRFAFRGTTPNGPGLTYSAKYAVVGAVTFGESAVMDGLNEKGLSAGAFYFPGFASYPEITAANQAQAVGPTEFVNWILTQCASIEELQGMLDQVVIAPTVVNNWGPVPTPMHYVVYDKLGKSLVIEPVDGKLQVYDNPIGVMTNSPTFDWHMTNLRNYINLRLENVAPRLVEGITLAPFGQGSGLVGLPGDFTPPSRFVRAAIFSSSALLSKTAEESVFQVFHILNQFDIPKGVAREKVGSTTYSDYTMVTSVKDPKNLSYYFRTYADQTIQSVDLNQFDLEGKVIKMMRPTTVQRAVDRSMELR